MKTCQWCEDSFETKLSYQIYCSSECRELATKDKIQQRYIIARRNRMIGKARHCKSCGSPLSAYNDEPICNSCSINPKDVARAIKEMKDIATDASE